MNIKTVKGLQKQKKMASYYILYKLPTPPEPDPPGPTPPDPPTPTPGAFTPWFNHPGDSIINGPWWIDRDFGGYNRIPYRRYWGMYPIPEYYPTLAYYSVLPNCTGWAEGRVRYCINNVTTPGYYAGNAGNWYGSATWPTSQTPSLCAVACWGNGGPGHVAIVESINYDGNGNWVSCVLSESSYSNSIWGFNNWHFGGVQNAMLYRNNLNRWYGYHFQGFINTPSNLIVR